MSKSSIKSFISLIQEIDIEERAQRDRGTLFELLIKTYLKNEPIYQRLFEEVWLLNEVPAFYNIPKVDTGVDLVAKKTRTGGLVAIQCKYYSKDTVIRKSHIDSFLNEVGKNFYDEGMIIATTDKWSRNAEDALINRNKSIMRISLSQLKESRIDWSKFTFAEPEDITLREKKTPRKHQVPAIKSVIEAFETTDRGKLIMAPGTGKTYTSMAIAENMARKTKDTFKVLYLVPSIQLLSQTLRAWNEDIDFNMDSIAVCSDRKVTKVRIGTEIEDIATADIGFPATTNTEKLLDYQKTIETKSMKPEFITVFSTYQSIDVISEAQNEGFYEFDLIICDEAHRTTGTTEVNQEESAFTKVHSNKNIQAKKRLYQTATPRVYGEDAKRKAEEKSVVIADMNDSQTFGEELYRIGFGDAIRNGILTDYKVMVLAVEEDVIARRFQNMFAQNESGLQFDDVTKIIGCWNGLVKRDGKTNKTLGQPMKRAIAFTGTIKDSKNITEMFSTVVDEYLYKNSDGFNHQFKIEIQHADGTMNAIEKNEKIDWLKSEVPDNTCRVLSNARFLTEGVDVPDLDAVMFLKPRKSKIDIAQAVGRVMRKAEGKDYGYIILPIGVPAGSEAHSILDNNEKYAVVWEILNALRSIDERFDAVINKIELNKKKPNQVNIIGVGDAPENGDLQEPPTREEQLALDLSEENLNDLEKAIYGKIVKKVGNVRYWEQWSEKVAEIAQLHITRIKVILEDKESKTFKVFDKFLKSFRHNINQSISEQQAIEMLAQHMITQPVFNSLFEKESFALNNPISQAMDEMIKSLESYGLNKEQGELEGFYESVRIRAEGIDNLEAKQKIIIQLYEKFFKVGFPNTTDQLGIVFTPIEIVDFIIRSTEDILKRHLGKSMNDEKVNILDPFTGTGTFITRLLQIGVIDKDRLLYKYTNEIFANEIVLLSYYIAAINIEETFKEVYGTSDYHPYEGIVLTDTFDSTEQQTTLDNDLFGDNNKRLEKQKQLPITVIMGNPPYLAKQDDTNANISKNQYPFLDNAIKNSYVKYSDAGLKNSLYDSYIRAFRWATDRIKGNGIVSFVTNGAYIDSQSSKGLRKSFYEDFNYIYIFNLRGNQRTVGELSRKEGGKVFGSGSRAPIAITILVKDGSDNHEIYYKDIGDYLTREEKLEIISKSSATDSWTAVKPDKNNDWINQKDEQYEKFIALNEPRETKNLFNTRIVGVATSRDSWVYGFGKNKLNEKAARLITNYNSELNRLKSIMSNEEKLEKINRNNSFIKWTINLLKKFTSGQSIQFDSNKIVLSLYRPFTLKYLYYDTNLIERPSQYQKYKIEKDSLMIVVPGNGNKSPFTAIVTNFIPEKHLITNGQVLFMEYNFKEDSILSANKSNNINTNIFNDLSNEEVFYYVYGILHSPDYRERYSQELLKGSARIPNCKNKGIYIDIGKQLIDLHLNFEESNKLDDVEIKFHVDNPSYKVTKMRFGTGKDRSIIKFNSDITIKNIPEEAYQYFVSSRTAIEWIIDQYQIKTDTKSGIVDDPNDYSSDSKYIFNLLLSIIYISVNTVKLTEQLPSLEIIE